MNIDEKPDNFGTRIWGCSKHSIEQFIERNKFLGENDYRLAIITMLKMMNKAVFLCYEERDIFAEIYTYGSWIFVTKESTIVTVYEKKGSKFEKFLK